MKKLSLLIAAGAFVFAACNQTAKDATQETATEVTEGTDAIAASGIMEFEETEFNFGKIKEGEQVEHVFKFKNTGEAPIVVAQVSASCGCTTPTYTSTPVKPGEVGEITVKFDSHGQVGQQQKIITIASNAQKRVTTVQLKGEVAVL